MVNGKQHERVKMAVERAKHGETVAMFSASEYTATDISTRIILELRQQGIEYSREGGRFDLKDGGRIDVNPTIPPRPYRIYLDEAAEISPKAIEKLINKKD